MKTITIRFAAPLQSFGNEASFNRRTSYMVPSKSAVIGLVAAALGYKRDSSKINDLNALHFAVRMDQPGKMMTDFQIVEYQKSTTKTARKLTYRDYLQDAVFTVALGTEDEKLINKIEYSLHHPVFQLYFGRRALAPAGVLKTKNFAGNPLTVLEKLPWQAAEWYQTKHHTAQYGCYIFFDSDLDPNAPVEMVKDKVGSFDPKSRFHRYRAMSRKKVLLDNKNYKEQNTGHDIMAWL